MSAPDPGTAPDPDRPPISAARLRANRRNALKSAGPITEAGKARARLNAWKHGFRAESDLVAPDEASAVSDRRAEWAPAFPAAPGEGFRGWIAQQIAVASVRIDRCQAHQRAQASYEADRASSSWDLDRAADAAKLGARLPKDPDRVVSSLLKTLAGVDWLRVRWQGLADGLDAGVPWDDARRRLCLDLMRIPDEFRESDLAMLEALPIDELGEIVREHLDALDEARAAASILDQTGRSLAEVGLPTAEGSELARLRRYESGLWRRFRSLEASYRASASPLPDTIAGPDAVSFSGMSAADLDRDLGLDPEDEDEDEDAPYRDLDDHLGLDADLDADLDLGLDRVASAPVADPDPVPTRPGPPGPRPNRAAIRNAPAPPPAVSPDDPRSSLPASSPPPVLQNRRARRASISKKKKRR
jgi:hypothetical protein